jgi:hypothetical protein
MKRFLTFLKVPFQKFARLSVKQRALNVGIITVGIFALSSAHFVSAQTNQVGVDDLTIASDTDHGITFKDLRPEQCRAVGQDLDVTNVVSGGNPLVGTAANDMIFADATTADIAGGDGDDCIVTGPATTHIDGGNGNNVCVVSATFVDANAVNCKIEHLP